MSYPREVTRRYLIDLLKQFEQGELEVEFLLFTAKDGGVISFTWSKQNECKDSPEPTGQSANDTQQAGKTSHAGELSEGSAVQKDN